MLKLKARLPHMYVYTYMLSLILIIKLYSQIASEAFGKNATQGILSAGSMIKFL